MVLIIEGGVVGAVVRPGCTGFLGDAHAVCVTAAWGVAR